MGAQQAVEKENGWLGLMLRRSASGRWLGFGGGYGRGSSHARKASKGTGSAPSCMARSCRQPSAALAGIRPLGSHPSPEGLRHSRPAAQRTMSGKRCQVCPVVRQECSDLDRGTRDLVKISASNLRPTLARLCIIWLSVVRLGTTLFEPRPNLRTAYHVRPTTGQLSAKSGQCSSMSVK